MVAGAAAPAAAGAPTTDAACPLLSRHALLSQLQAKQAEGFAVAVCTTGTEREGPLRNLFYHVLLRKQA